MARGSVRKLLVVVPDRHLRASLETLIGQRWKDLGMRPEPFEVRRHPDSDPGCRMATVAFLRTLEHDYERVLVVFDHDGCGSGDSPEEIERRVEADLAANGWRGRSRVIVIAPELEAWVWGRSEGALRALGWKAGFPALRNWLAGQGRWPPAEPKPPDPKEAVALALRLRHRVPDARFFRSLAAAADFADCRDRAFRELRATLCAWYPPVPRPKRYGS